MGADAARAIALSCLIGCGTPPQAPAGPPAPRPIASAPEPAATDAPISSPRTNETSADPPQGESRAEDATVASVSSGPADSARVIAGMRQGLRRCYQAALATAPELDVKLSVRVRIDANGTPTVLDVTSSDTPPPSFVSCVEGRVEQAAFEPPQNGTTQTLVIPLVFKKD